MDSKPRSSSHSRLSHHKIDHVVMMQFGVFQNLLVLSSMRERIQGSPSRKSKRWCPNPDKGFCSSVHRYHRSTLHHQHPSHLPASSGTQMDRPARACSCSRRRSPLALPSQNQVLHDLPSLFRLTRTRLIALNVFDQPLHVHCFAKGRTQQLGMRPGSTFFFHIWFLVPFGFFGTTW